MSTIIKTTNMSGLSSFVPNAIYMETDGVRAEITRMYVANNLGTGVRRIIDHADVQGMIDTSIGGAGACTVPTVHVFNGAVTLDVTSVKTYIKIEITAPGGVINLIGPDLTAGSPTENCIADYEIEIFNTDWTVNTFSISSANGSVIRYRDASPITLPSTSLEILKLKAKTLTRVDGDTVRNWVIEGDIFGQY